MTETWYDSSIRQKVKDPLIITARALEGEIYELAKSFQKKGGLSAKDAVHLACASFVGADVFLTCDDRLIRQAKRLRLETGVMNPVDYTKEPLSLSSSTVASLLRYRRHRQESGFVFKDRHDEHKPGECALLLSSTWSRDDSGPRNSC